MPERKSELALAAAHARRAIRRGDIKTAARWLKIAGEANDVTKQVAAEARNAESRKRFLSSRAAVAEPAHKPVMVRKRFDA